MFAKLKTAWLAFNHWRRSAFPFRLTVLLILLVFACDLPWRVITPNHSPLINELVWIACKAIRYSSEPRVPSAYLHYYRARENQRLQNELRVRIKGGLLLSPDDLSAVNAMPSKVDNKLMFDIAKRYGIISAGVSQREYMRSMWAASLSMTAMEFDKDWDDVRKQIFNTASLIEWPPSNWRLGVARFCNAFEQILPLPLVVTLPWFILCLTLAFIAVKNPSSIWWRTIAIVLPVLLTLAWTAGSIVEKNPMPFSYWDYYNISYIAYFSILAVIAGILGIRLRLWTLKKGNMDKFFPWLLFIAGVLLIFQFSYKPEKDIVYSWCGRSSGDILCNISFNAKILLSLVGAGMTIYAVRAFSRLQPTGRIQRFRISPGIFCYLFWGITVMWACYLLLFWSQYVVIDVMIGWLKISVFIGSILCGLSFSGPYPKNYFQIINICAIVLLLVIIVVLIFSCCEYYTQIANCVRRALPV